MMVAWLLHRRSADDDDAETASSVRCVCPLFCFVLFSPICPAFILSLKNYPQSFKCSLGPSGGEE